MPTSTTRYRFEFRLHDWAEALSLLLCGRRCAFFVGVREDGSLKRVYFAPPEEPFDGPAKAQLAEAYPRWFLYVPYQEAEGSAYLEWLGLEQGIAERWLGRRFESSDFLDVRATGTRDGWPESWRVIVS